MSNSGAVTLGEIGLAHASGSVLTVRAARPAERCRLIAQHGADAKLPVLREVLAGADAAQCEAASCQLVGRIYGLHGIARLRCHSALI